MANELSIVREAIYLRLTKSPDADALTAIIPATRIHARRAPQPPVYDYIFYTWQSGADETTLNKTRLIVPPLYYIRLVKKLTAASSAIPDNFKTAANELDNLMHTMRRQTYAEISGYSFNSWREMPMERTYPDPNDSAGEIYELGGLYRIQAFS